MNKNEKSIEKFRGSLKELADTAVVKSNISYARMIAIVQKLLADSTYEVMSNIKSASFDFQATNISNDNIDAHIILQELIDSEVFYSIHPSNNDDDVDFYNV
ncbi:hypothetical protein KSF78_0009465 [Schistosoma japonicum]|nr:hypothetical protein KSF78_0009465 [Schistosoma japonicum]